MDSILPLKALSVTWYLLNHVNFKLHSTDVSYETIQRNVFVLRCRSRHSSSIQLIKNQEL